MKPWARIEIGYLNHPKFLWLNANAICLWHEGKQYCDMHLTDGLIPRDALKTFRFAGRKSVAMLLSTCLTPRPDGTPYTPLWEAHPVGYKMHDYLDHNECRDAVLARLEQADESRSVDRERLKRWRAAKKRKRETPQETLLETLLETPDTPFQKRHGNAAETLYTVSVSETDPSLVKNTREGEEAPAAPPRPMAPIHDRSHRQHALCGRVCLHASQFNDFVRRRNHPNADQEIREWAASVLDAWSIGPHAQTEPGDPYDFWRARYAETWPVIVPAKSPSKWSNWTPKPRVSQS